MTARRQIRLLALAAALFGGGGSAHAGDVAKASANPSGWDGSVNFDLSRDVPFRAGPMTSSGGEANDSSGPRLDWRTEIDSLSAHEELGPRWSYQPARSGPSLELAALGAGKKERPGLAHIAVDWNF